MGFQSLGDALVLAKFEALGNDFLVAVDPDGSMAFDAALAASLCDRHRGVGADGLITLAALQRPGAVRMRLRNADGGEAETSGNGLRCAALAALDAGLVDERDFEIETTAGLSRARVGPDRDDGSAEVSVTMGELDVAEVESPLRARRAFRVDAGNPHLVLIGDSFDDVDLDVLGPELDAVEPDGTNVELVSPATFEVAPEDDVALDMAVWERGVGRTLACGSGSAAAAAAARLAGLGGAPGQRITVVNPGGRLLVDLVGADPRRPSVTLTGPARRVATVHVALERLLASLGATA